MPSRRHFVAAAAGGTLALVAAGGVWRVTRRPTTATTPWDLPAPPPEDIRMDAFRHAILAPNPHNMQPWIIRLDGTDGASIFCDPDRRLPQTDPFDRQISIGFGCFLELARLAAAERGYQIDITPFPDGAGTQLDARPVAALRFQPADIPRDPLFAAIPDRRSNKEEYDLSRPLTDADLAPVLTAGGTGAAGTVAPTDVAAIREIVVEAVGIEYRVPRVHRESVDVMRIGHAEIDATPDGIPLAGPAIEAMAATGLMTREALADTGSMAWKTGADLLERTYGSAPGFVWLVTADNDRETQLRAGMAYARMNLAAAVAGLAMHPMSQSLQEYAEVAEPYRAIHQLLAADGGTVQMLARMGHWPLVGPTPRWPLETRLGNPVN